MDYGDTIYGNAVPTTLCPLKTAYHSAIRFITGDAFLTHHCLLYDNVGWPSLENRRKLHLYMFIFKAFTGKLPPYISSMLNFKSIPHSIRSTGWITFGVPFMRTDLGKTAFSALAPSTWNKLQATHSHSQSVNTWRPHLLPSRPSVTGWDSPPRQSATGWAVHCVEWGAVHGADAFIGKLQQSWI